MVSVILTLFTECANADDGVFEVIFAIPEIFPILAHVPPRVLISTNYLELLSVTLTVHGTDIQHNVQVSRYNYVDITLPTFVRLKKGDVLQNRTVFVRASAPVSVLVIDNEYGNHDGFIALNSRQLGTQHYIASYTPDSTKYPSSFCLSALGENTQVTIQTRAGQEYAVTLSAYQSFRFDGVKDEDLTGTYINSDKPIAVISGTFAQVPVTTRASDALMVQNLPLRSWGTNFILSPFLGRDSGYIYRVIAANTTTKLEISNIGGVQVSANDGFFEEDVPGDTMISIISDKPVMLVQYMKGHFSDDKADPSMLLVPPLDLYTKSNVSFVTYIYEDDISSCNFSINVIINCNAIEGLVLNDNISVLDWNRLSTNGNPPICSVRGSLLGNSAYNVAHVDSLTTFSVSVYPVCTFQSSYAYLAGILDEGKWK